MQMQPGTWIGVIWRGQPLNKRHEGEFLNWSKRNGMQKYLAPLFSKTILQNILCTLIPFTIKLNVISSKRWHHWSPDRILQFLLLGHTKPPIYLSMIIVRNIRKFESFPFKMSKISDIFKWRPTYLLKPASRSNTSIKFYVFPIPFSEDQLQHLRILKNIFL